MAIIAYALSFSFCNSYGQTSLQPKQTHAWFIEPELRYGFIVSHHTFMDRMVIRHFPAITLSTGILTNGNKYWQSAYAYPKYGITGWYSDLGNYKLFGNTIALMPFIDLPFTEPKHCISHSLRISAGLGYISRTYNLQENYKNIAISTHINAAVAFAYYLRAAISSRYEASISTSLMHFSNGGNNMPNYGVNIFTANSSLVYKLGNLKSYDAFPKPTLQKHTEFQVISGFGIKGIEQCPANKKYQVYFIEADVKRHIGYKSAILAGVDLNYDKTDLHYLHRDIPDLKNNLDILRPGIHAGHELKIQNVSLVFLVGTYAYSKYKQSNEEIYSKLAVRYTFQNHWILNVSLKSHKAMAEFVGYGVGYKF